METEEIVAKLKEIFKIVIGTEFDLKNNNMELRLVDDLGLTSINILYMVIAIEQNFDIIFNDVGVNDFQTVGDVVKYIKNNL